MVSSLKDISSLNDTTRLTKTGLARLRDIKDERKAYVE